MTKLPVIAAVPNYNMASELKRLIPQLLKQGYKAIYVLDDASTDNSAEVVKSFGNKVILVQGKENKGAGGNRNRIIRVLNYEAIIHFLDADVTLEGNNTAQLVKEAVPDEPFGFMGGLAYTPRGIQSVWNYGPKYGLRGDIAAQIQFRLEPLFISNPEKAARIRNRHKRLLAEWPNPLVKPVKHEVYWCIEQNLILRSDIFKQLGGFDESLRETEILEFAIRTHQRGLKSYFDPSIVVHHTEADVRQYNRNRRKAKEGFRNLRKYGIFNWLFG